MDFDSYSSDLWVVIPVAYTITLVTQLMNNTTIFISQMYVILFSVTAIHIMVLELVVAIFSISFFVLTLYMYYQLQ